MRIGFAVTQNILPKLDNTYTRMSPEDNFGKAMNFVTPRVNEWVKDLFGGVEQLSLSRPQKELVQALTVETLLYNSLMSNEEILTAVADSVRVASAKARADGPSPAGRQGDRSRISADAEASEQRRHRSDLERAEINGPVSEAQRERDRRLVLEHGALAERRNQAGAGILPRYASEAGNDAIERTQGGSDLSFGHHPVDVEHLEDLLDFDDGDLQIAVETAARAELERAGAGRDHTLLCDARFHDLDPAAPRLPLPQFWQATAPAKHHPRHAGLRRPRRR